MRRVSSLLGIMITASMLIGRAAIAEDSVIPATEEPRHRVKLENPVVRIVDVEIPPGDQTLLHSHSLDYAFLMVNRASLLNEVQGKPPVDLSVAAGLIGYYRATQGAYIHRFTNVGTQPFRAIGIELLAASPTPEVSAALPGSSGYVTVLDNERVRAYRLVLAPGQSTPSVTLPGRTVRVAGTNATLVETIGADSIQRRFEPAMFEWRAAPSTQTLKNTGDAPVTLYEFEIK